ncbi:hypothetical protein FWK35_00038263 [Aphis craccivora]|nr:hypothetical protein FWK35_00038263 [Aphis craccivora]
MNLVGAFGRSFF